MSSSENAAPSLIGLLRPYRFWIALLLLLAVLSNGLSLYVPRLIADGIDAFTAGTLDVPRLALTFSGVAAVIFILVYLQGVVQTYASELVARDVRRDLSDAISRQSYAYVQQVSPGTLLTNLTSDVDALKLFISQAVVSIVSSLLLIVGTSVLLLLIDWRLALCVIAIIPLIGGTFFFVLRKVRVLFKKTQEVIDWLNKVINESILGSALIRVLNAQQHEYDKFLRANTEARDTGMQILRMFAAMIPVVTFVSNMASLAILLLGGHFVIQGSLSLGNFTAFNTYLSILIFPIFVVGFMSNVIARSAASYGRIATVLHAEPPAETGTVDALLRGDIAFKNVTMTYGEKQALKDVSFAIKAGTRVAIIGPTAAGKTQLLQLLIGLIPPTSGTVEYDSRPIQDYLLSALHRQIGFVFQDSVLFNLTLRENIAFSKDVDEAAVKKAIDTAELREFIDTLPQGLETVVSERGTSLSGGQKQRIMLARALALNPKILLLDDFTARVDTATEQKILASVRANYPGITLVSVTQKISSITDFDQIILLMEGELLATGTHEELMKTSPEYVQIEQSQHSTNAYELRA